MITIRDAQLADLPALMAIKGEGSAALHRDRLRDAQNPTFRYLVLLKDGEIIGFACLVSQRPAYWSDGGDTEHLPCIIDLQVKESRRGQGFGSEFIRQIEAIAAWSGFKQIYIAVEPLDNPLAYALYQRLGYQQIQPEPYLKAWDFTDSAGMLHCGEDSLVDMVKAL
jgi:GNAT superfamily N-acetyltransferase